MYDSSIGSFGTYTFHIPYFLTVSKLFVSTHLDNRVVDEDISPLLVLDESKTMLLTKPANDSFLHNCTSVYGLALQYQSSQLW